jgi:hypothetical protein
MPVVDPHLTEAHPMAVNVKRGDRIHVDSEKAGAAAREGEILEIIEHEYALSYRVRWDDGHESTIRPTPGTTHTTPPQPTKR